MQIEIISKNTWWIKKVRNGLWRVMQGNKKYSEHSTEKGAKAMLERLIKP